MYNVHRISADTMSELLFEAHEWVYHNEKLAIHTAHIWYSLGMWLIEFYYTEG